MLVNMHKKLFENFRNITEKKLAFIGGKWYYN